MYNYYCANCGISASASAKFCRQCGAKLATQSGGLPAIEPTGKSVLPDERTTAVVPKSGASEDRPPTSYERVIAPRFPESSSEMKAEIARKNGSTGLVARLTQALGQMRARLHKPALKSSAKLPAASNQGAARALERASGLTSHHPFNSALRIAGIALAILLTASAFLVFRDQNRSTLNANRSGLNLTAPDDKSRQYVLLGKQDHDLGHYDAAIDDFKQAITLLPNNTEAHFLLAKSYKAAGRIDDSLQSYTQVIKIDERHLEARYQIATIYSERGDWRAALPEYERIITLDHSSEQALNAVGVLERYYAQRAANYAPLRTPRPTDAQPQSTLRWLPSSDSSSHLHPLLPDLTLSALSRPPLPGINNSTDDASSARALAVDYKDKAFRYFNIHQYNAAIKDAQAALAFTPDDTDLYFIIASSYRATGQPELALEHFRKCVSGTYAPNCRQMVKDIGEAVKKADAKKKKESQRSNNNPLKSIVNTFK